MQKALTCPQHCMFGSENSPQQRLKSRHGFLSSVQPLSTDPVMERLRMWKEECPEDFVEPKETLPPGKNLEWPVWRSLNRLRVNVGRARANMVTWGFLEREDPALCECGARQTMDHLRCCPSCPASCSMDDLFVGGVGAVEVARHWANTV